MTMKLVYLAVLLVFVHGAPNPGKQYEDGDFFCYHCDDATDNKDCKVVTKCPSGQDRCLTQVWFNEYGLTIGKRCAKMQICYNYAENNPDGCDNPDEEMDGYCSYCCDTPGCNNGLPPYPNSAPPDKDARSSGSSAKGGILGVLKLIGAGNKHSSGGKSGGKKSGGKTPGHIGPGGKTPGHIGPGGKSPGHIGPGGKSPGHIGPGGKSPGHIGPGGKSPGHIGPGGKTPGGKSGVKTPGGKTSGGKSGVKTPGGKTSGGKSGVKTPGGKTSGGKSGVKTPGGKTSGGKSGVKTPGGKTSGGKSGVKTPGGKTSGVKTPGGKTSGGKSGGHAKTHKAIHHTATHPPATHPPITHPPVTHAPVTHPPQSTAQPVKQACHCHNGQPCYQNHINTGTNNQNPGGVLVNNGAGGIDIKINLQISGLLMGNLNTGTCPCAQKKPIVGIRTAPTQKSSPTVPVTVVVPPLSNQPVPQTTQKPLPPSTTTAPTTATTTSTTTTTTTPLPTTTPKHSQCYTCSDASCFTMKLAACPAGKSFCMSTVSQSLTGQRNFSKSCVDETECKTKWWLSTSGIADCFTMDSSPSGLPGLKLDGCSFCCHGDGCNKQLIPPQSTLYQPKSSVSATQMPTTVMPPKPQTRKHATSGATSAVTTSSSSPTTSSQSTTQTLTTQSSSRLPSSSPASTSTLASSSTSTSTSSSTSTSKPGLSCQVCGDWTAGTPCGAMDIIVPQYKTCKLGEYCMTDAVWVDSLGTNSLYKRCVSHSMCDKQWYHQTSDKSMCMHARTAIPSKGTECHYCCTKSNCNQGVVPNLQTLYRP